jgi:hypothetical protein
MVRRIRLGVAICGLTLAVPSVRALAQGSDEYGQPVHMSEQELAVNYIAGRYASPITCKKTDGTVVQAEDSMLLKVAPEEGGDNGLKATFFGVEVGDVSYCYNLISRRVVDRRGTIVLRYLSHNRKDLGDHDFRRAAASGSLTYTATGGELNEHGIGSDPGDAPARTLHFEGKESKLVVAPVQQGTDGAKLFADYDARAKSASAAPAGPGEQSNPSKRFSFRFIASDGSEFTFYAIEDSHRRR